MKSQRNSHWLRPVVILAVLVAIPIAIVALLLGLAAWLSVLVGLVVGAAVSGGLLIAADSIVLRMTRARPADPKDHARLFNQVEALCLAHGVVEPELYVTDDSLSTAMAFGRRLDRPSIVVTSGLLEAFPIIEIEAVIAHLLSRIRRGDTRADTVVAVFVEATLAPFGSISDRLAARFLAPQAEIHADMDGVRMTRYPPGLIAALVTMENPDAQLQSPARAIRHMWIHEQSPARAGEWPASLQDRISILREL